MPFPHWILNWTSMLLRVPSSLFTLSIPYQLEGKDGTPRHISKRIPNLHRKKKPSKPPQEGPRASALVAAPGVSVPEALVGIAVGTGKAFDVGANTGHVLKDDSPGISISGATLTFHRPARVIPVSSWALLVQNVRQTYHILTNSGWFYAVF